MHDRLKKKDIWSPVPQNPVLRRGRRGSWDSDAVLDPCLVAADGGYALWYNGRRQTTDGDGRKRVYAQIGHAVSKDGIGWEKHSDPVFGTGSENGWDSAHIYYPSVLKAGDGFRMYYHGDDALPGRSQIGLAFSRDGLSWKRHAGNPVIRHGGAGDPDNYMAAVPNVFSREEGFGMIYCHVAKRGKEELWGIALAVSADGIVWTNRGIVISLHEERKNISSPTVVYIDKRYYLWAWVFDHAHMADNHVRLYQSRDLLHWHAVWETGWANPWAENEVSRSFFMPRIFQGSANRLFLFYPIRYDRGVCDTGLAIAEL